MVLCLALGACKKGQDDPAFTLVTRRARVAGDWKMTGGHVTVVTKDYKGTYNGVSYSFGESTFDSVIIGTQIHAKGKYTFTISFTKQGAVSIQQKIGISKFEATGTWDFLGAQGEYNKKERMTIQLNDMSGSLSRNDFFDKANSTFTYRIKELRSSKMVLVTEQEVMAADLNGTTSFITSDYTFVQ